MFRHIFKSRGITIKSFLLAFYYRPNSLGVLQLLTSSSDNMNSILNVDAVTIFTMNSGMWIPSCQISH